MHPTQLLLVVESMESEGLPQLRSSEIPTEWFQSLLTTFVLFFGDMGIRAEAVTIDADAVNFEFAIKANPTLVNCLRVWRNCKKGGKE